MRVQVPPSALNKINGFIWSASARRGADDHRLTTTQFTTTISVTPEGVGHHVTLHKRIEFKESLFGREATLTPKLRPRARVGSRPIRRIDRFQNVALIPVPDVTNWYAALLTDFLARAQCVSKGGTLPQSRGWSRTKRDGTPPSTPFSTPHLTDPTIAASSISCPRCSIASGIPGFAVQGILTKFLSVSGRVWQRPEVRRLISALGGQISGAQPCANQVAGRGPPFFAENHDLFRSPRRPSTSITPRSR
jgi:hypothetical protein